MLSEPRLGLAMLVGALVGIPGASYLAALHNLVTGRSSTATQVIAVVIFVIIDFLLIIIPFAFLELRPEATRARLRHTQDWLLSHALQLMTAIALLLGAYLAISGLVRLSAASPPPATPAACLRLTLSASGRMARRLPYGPHATCNAAVIAKAAGAGGNHPPKSMTHPDGSNRIGPKPPGSPGEGSAILAWTDSGAGGQHDIGNNNHAQGHGRAPRGTPGRRAGLLRVRSAARGRLL